jgi:hypothetical protein
LTANAGGEPFPCRRYGYLDARPIVRGRLGEPVEFGYKAQLVDNPDGTPARSALWRHDRLTPPATPKRSIDPVIPAYLLLQVQIVSALVASLLRTGDSSSVMKSG